MLDNVSYHSKRKCAILEDWLWKRFDIFVLFLPPRTPEWNPIELLWNNLVRNLGTYPLSVIRDDLRKNGSSIDAVAYVAKRILDGMDHDLVKKCYDHCFKGVL